MTARFTYGNISGNWEQLHLIPTRKLATFEMDPGGAPNAEVKVTITGKLLSYVARLCVKHFVTMKRYKVIKRSGELNDK